MTAEDERRAREGNGPPILTLTAVAAAVVAVIMAAAALWAGHPAGASTDTASSTSTVVANGQTKTFNIKLGDLWVSPSSISVAYGTRVVLTVTNTGAMNHDLQLNGGSVGPGMLSPGQHKTVDYGVFGSTEQAWCTVPGHKAAGMILTIKVTGGPSATQSSSASTSSGGTTSSGASSGDATITAGATPAKGWQPVSASLAAAPATTVHHVTLVAEDKEIQVAPGVTQDMWTYNGQYPAPVLRGNVGDTWVVTLVNHTNMSHNLDFHAASQSMASMPEVAPGKSVTMTFRTMYSGVYMYHCGTAPAIEHIANGMFGAMIINPPNLAKVSQEFVIVQSELYLGPQDQSGDYAKMLSGDASAVVFNGYYDGYEYSPIKVKVGEKIRIFVLDAGPSDDSSFHVVGAQFTTEFNNGAYLVQPGNSADGAAQTLNLMPGEGGFVEFTVPQAGQYEMVDHHFDHAAAGAAGYIVASN